MKFSTVSRWLRALLWSLTKAMLAATVIYFGIRWATGDMKVVSGVIAAGAMLGFAYDDADVLASAELQIAAARRRYGVLLIGTSILVGSIAFFWIGRIAIGLPLTCALCWAGAAMIAAFTEQSPQ